MWFWKNFHFYLFNGLLLIIPVTKILIIYPFLGDYVVLFQRFLPKPKEKFDNFLVYIDKYFNSCFSFIPLSELTKFLFIDATNRVQTWFFPQRMNNTIMLWAALNGLIGLFLFYFSYKIYGKYNGVEKSMFGISISLINLFKTILVSLLIVSSYFILLSFIYFLFHIDYRFIFISAKVFNKEHYIFYLFIFLFSLVFSIQLLKNKWIFKV